MGYRVLFLLAVFLGNHFFATEVFALPEDRTQPVEIESNKMHRNEKSGITTYEGAVVIRQGSIKIEASKVVISSQNNKVYKIVGTGAPARYQQKPAHDKDIIVAHADRIEYLLSDDVITLMRNASLEQSGGTIIGEQIEYDLKSEIVNAKGSDNGNQRIQMVIPAKNLNKSKSNEDK